MLEKSSVPAGFLTFMSVLQMLAAAQNCLLLRLKSLQKVGASNTKSPCVTPVRWSTGALVGLAVQSLDDVLFTGGQFPDFGSSVGGGEGLFGGRLAGSRGVQLRAHDFVKS